jgi:DNA-binding CsgD family transcriptional regulator
MDADEIRRALPLLRRETALPVVFGGAVGEPVDGVRSLRITELLGCTTDSLRGLAVRAGFGLGGKAIKTCRPVWVGDYSHAETISHDYDVQVSAEGLHTIIAVPVVVRRQIRGVLYSALRHPVNVGDRPLMAAMGVAREVEQDLAVADAARRSLAEARLAVRPEARGPGRLAESARLEELRHLHAELRGLADQVTDLELRDRMRSACDRLAATVSPPEVVPGEPRPSLSPRELDVLSCVAIGCTNASTAHQLGLLPETVKSYLRSAMRKLGSHTRLEAVATARRSGLLP